MCRDSEPASGDALTLRKLAKEIPAGSFPALRATALAQSTFESSNEFQPMPVLAFNTSRTSGGTVINVAGDYITCTGQEVHTDVKIKIYSALDKLLYANGASWSPTLVCLPGTRVTMLSEIRDWSYSLDKRNLLLVKGVAGSGKSAIAHSVAQALHECGLLTSSFFFDRESSSRNTSQLLLTTIARDIASLYPAIAADISAALEKEPALATANLSRQFESFIAGPLRRHSIDRQIIIVIDALDEAIRDDTDTDLLTILRDDLPKLSRRCRFIITSRPTRVIEQFLSRKEHVESIHVDINSLENCQDISAYVDAMLQDDTICSQMGSPWPDEALICDLKMMAGGLFIWIATVFAYLRSAHRPRAKLRALLSKSHPQGPLEPTKKIDNLYVAILEVCGDWDDADFREDYAMFMGAIMAVKRPLPIAALRALHGENQELSLQRLPQRFGSVLVGLHSEHEPIRTLHLSFREFVTIRAADNAQTSKFFLSEKEHSERLARLCIRTMVRELTVAPVKGTGYLAGEYADPPGIPKLDGVSEQLIYSCESWGDHIRDIERPTAAIVEGLQEMLLHHNATWVEIVSSSSVFRGSLSVRRWLQANLPALLKLHDDQSQALILLNLSKHLRYLGRLEEALTAAEDSVHLNRALAAHSKPPAQSSAGLARSLVNLSSCLAYCGQPEAALAAVEEALALYRALAAEEPAAFNSWLAQSLVNLSDRLIRLGRREEALAAIQEDVVLYRALAAARPAANAWFAHALNSLSVGLSDLGQHEEALATVQEAVGLYRALASEKQAASSSDLAVSLHNLAVCLSALGRCPEALMAIQEAVGLRNTLAAEQPAEFKAHLAHSLVSLSKILSDLHRLEEALASIRQAVAYDGYNALLKIPAAPFWYFPPLFSLRHFVVQILVFHLQSYTTLQNSRQNGIQHI
ncbi:hypothetical protein HWV62_29114 [Athelia sp. TMB]|nr:hypothetical protein HWV62_29114 [Athelia sp. TMB]